MSSICYYIAVMTVFVRFTMTSVRLQVRSGSSVHCAASGSCAATTSTSTPADIRTSSRRWSGAVAPPARRRRWATPRRTRRARRRFPPATRHRRRRRRRRRRRNTERTICGETGLERERRLVGLPLVLRIRPLRCADSDRNACRAAPQNTALLCQVNTVQAS